VDKLCSSLFLESRSKESDHNLGAVSNHLLGNRDLRADILSLYQKILKNQKVLDDNANPLINKLLLSGLVKIEQHCLKVRNRIYAQAFNQQWIDSNMPDTEKRRQESARQLGFWQATAIATTAVMLLGSWVFWYWDSYIGIFVAMMLVLAGGGIWYWDSYIREVSTYWNTYVKRFGLPHGVGQLKKSQLKGRSVTYRFLQKGRKNPVWKVQAIGSNYPNQLTIHHRIGTYFEKTDIHEVSDPKSVAWEFILDTSGRIVYEKAFNHKQQLIWGLVYSPPLSGQTINAHYVGEDAYPRSPANNCPEFVEITYSSDGDEIMIRYFDRAHQPQLGAYSAHRVDRRFDKRGLIIEEAYFDAEDQPVLDKDELVHRLVFQHDQWGNITEITFFDTEGLATFSKSDKHKHTRRYDINSNLIELAWFGIEGEPTLLSGSKTHKQIICYDIFGNRIEFAYFGLDGQPVTNDDDPTFHKETLQYDSRGYYVEFAHFGIDGKPCVDETGSCKWTVQRDSDGNRIGMSYFGVNGEPVFHSLGMHRWAAKYDGRGKVLECAYFGLEDKPVLDEDGVHKWTAQYDARGNTTEWAYFGLENESVFDEYGVHKWTAQYDARGNQTEWAYFGLEGEPIIHGKEGVHKWIAQYNSQGKQIECIHLGLESEPILDKYGIHKWTTSYDNQGNAIERIYFDTQGQTIRTQLTVISANDNSSLEANDILLSYDNQILTNKVIYRNLKAKTTIETPAKELQILRAGKPLSLLIKLKELDVELEDIAC